jgi:hypothetical protein
MKAYILILLLAIINSHSNEYHRISPALQDKKWEPPIGIPHPEFGIEENYRMYDNPAKRNPALNYSKNAGRRFLYPLC